LTKNRDELEKHFKKAGGENNILNKKQIANVLKNYPELSDEKINLIFCYVSANI
jgi:hypothetical protein